LRLWFGQELSCSPNITNMNFEVKVRPSKLV
jgi:hypothetical protein